MQRERDDGADAGDLEVGGAEPGANPPGGALSQPGAVPPAQPLWTRRGSIPSSPVARFSGLAAGSLLLALLVIFLTFPRSRPGGPAPSTFRVASKVAVSSVHPHLDALGVAVPLPTFADWRVAYLGRDGLLHIVALDGKRDVAASILPGMDPATLARSAADSVTALSPNGHLLAYTPGPPGATPHALVVVSLGAAVPPGPFIGDDTLVGAGNLRWSPDSAALAFDGFTGAAQGVYVLRIRDGHVTMVPGTRHGFAGIGEQVLGWIDASHLAVLVAPATRTGSPSQIDPHVRLGALDITSGNLRTITLLPSALTAYLSPDGRWTLIESGQGQPFAETIDMVRGQIRPLPNITEVAGGGAWEMAAWAPRTHTVAATVASGEVAVLDLDRDRATLVPSVADALGWVPASGRLVVGLRASAPDGRMDSIGALALFSSDPGAPVVLAAAAVAFLGFVRTT